jgi:hypothetical protein
VPLGCPIRPILAQKEAEIPIVIEVYTASQAKAGRSAIYYANSWTYVIQGLLSPGATRY